MVATRTRAQRTTLEIVSIVPSISMAWTIVLTTMITARSVCPLRHIIGRKRNGRRRAANSAVARVAHMAITPHAENGVGDAKRSASITSGALVVQAV